MLCATTTSNRQGKGPTTSNKQTTKANKQEGTRAIDTNRSTRHSSVSYLKRHPVRRYSPPRTAARAKALGATLDDDARLSQMTNDGGTNIRCQQRAERSQQSRARQSSSSLSSDSDDRGIERKVHRRGDRCEKLCARLHRELR